jgi:hypothetical protein
MKKTLSIIFKIAAFVLVLVAFLMFCRLLKTGAVLGYYDYENAIHWRDKTEPLDSTVIKDLCSTFVLPASDPKCKPGSIVYAPDFFEDVIKTFRTHDGIYATYDDVQKKIGKYQFKFEPPVTESDGKTYFVARYDFQGDRVFPIVMFFYGDGRLWRIVANTGG